MVTDAGVPNGIRTRVAAVKGRCPRPLDDGDRATRRRGDTVTNSSPRHRVSPSPRLRLVTRPGIEPGTNWLKASCSTSELPGPERRATKGQPTPRPFVLRNRINDESGGEIAAGRRSALAAELTCRTSSLRVGESLSPFLQIRKTPGSASLLRAAFASP